MQYIFTEYICARRDDVTCAITIWSHYRQINST